jgi:hypothetical protein
MGTYIRENGIQFSDGTTQKTAPLGFWQTWKNMTSLRSNGTTYRNTTGAPIMVVIVCTGNGDYIFSTSSNNSTWVDTGNANHDKDDHDTIFTFVIPDNWYYRIDNVGGITSWLELS